MEKMSSKEYAGIYGFFEGDELIHISGGTYRIIILGVYIDNSFEHCNVGKIIGLENIDKERNFNIPNLYWKPICSQYVGKKEFIELCNGSVDDFSIKKIKREIYKS